MRAILRPALLGVIGLACILRANSILNREGDVTSAPIHLMLELLAWCGLGTGLVGIVWACFFRNRPFWLLDFCFCSAVALFAVMTFVSLPSYIEKADSDSTTNQAEQVVTHQSVRSFSISFQDPVNRTGERTSNDSPKTKTPSWPTEESAHSLEVLSLAGR